MTKQRIKQSIFLILCFFILCTYCLSAKAITQSNEFKSFCNNEKNSINIHQIAYSPQWLSLVHYRPQLWGNYISSIDSDNFFLSKDGKTNPESELISTIKHQLNVHYLSQTSLDNLQNNINNNHHHHCTFYNHSPNII